MKRPERRTVMMGGAGLALLAMLVWGFLPSAEPVQSALVERGPLVATVEEEGVTRVEDRFLVTAPVAGFVRRIDLREGDAVVRGQPLASLEAPREGILDPRTRSEASSRAAAARSGVERAEQQARAAAAAADQAARGRDRVQGLLASGAVSRQDAEHATTAAAEAASVRDGARAAVTAARAELAAALAALGGPASDAGQPVVRVVTAPASGRVLAVHRRSEGLVAPGEPLLELGDPARLEVHARVRSQDAVRIRPGMRVLLDAWGGDTALEAVVARVDPEGSTVVSSLGVEEQRVTVVATLAPAYVEAAAGLGSGYRVLARFVVWEGANVLRVPTAALFRSGDGWAAFVVEEGRGRLRTVRIGQQAGLLTEVVDGLAAGEEVIVHPASSLTAGARVSTTREP